MIKIETLVKLRGVSVSYRNGRQSLLAISDIDLDIVSEEILAVVGRSGCGKTTLLKVVAGLIKPDKGEVIFNQKMFNGRRRKVGMMFQSPLLLPWRTVLKNVLLPIEVMGESVNEYLERALELIKMTGLKNFENSYPWELSGGMQQRVALCRALIHRPQLLLLDEPFGSLDAITREEMWMLLQNVVMEERCSTVLVTHDIREAVLLADRIVVMGSRPGRIKAEVKISFESPRSLELQYTREFNEYVMMIKNMLGE
ncbi:MAG: ABC transporter ATP-binding protein [Ignisphaera sp.]|nr:ABC transporter ATP-binding protein [Ignisphaera sp.]MDW8086184.1 ABC transporter ATP-binding protein [Ignisphaera sp.]